MRKIKITNKYLLAASIFGIIGSLILGIHKLTITKNWVLIFNRYRNIENALIYLNKYDTKMQDGTMAGCIRNTTLGFSELVYIIKDNNSDLYDKDIIQLTQNSPLEPIIPKKDEYFKFYKGDMDVIHARISNTSKSYVVTFKNIFNEWINDDKEKYIFQFGIIFLFISFTLGVRGRIEFYCDDDENKSIIREYGNQD